MANLLLLEDNETLGGGLSKRLTQEGHSLVWCKTLAEAKAKVRMQSPDLVIVDIALPDGSGIDFAKLELLPRKIPAVVLSAFSSAEYRMDAFDAGALDFVPKPFHLRELLIRIQHVLARITPRTHPLLVLPGLTIDLVAGSIERGSERVLLAPRELALLKALIAAAPAVVSRQELADSVWKDDGGAAPRTVDNAVVRLRQLLGTDHEERIRSVRGVGYQWLG